MLGRFLSGVLVLAAGCTAAEDHAALLEKAVRADGVDYAVLAEERGALDAYVAWLKDAAPGKERAAQIAFWINAYNALTLQQVLDTKPAEGTYRVTDVEGFWTKRAWTVAGRRLTLDEIEKGILLKELDEPLVHFALNCASRSCPPLRPSLYEASTLASVLPRQTRAYLADARENVFHLDHRHAELSKVFEWYRKDFERGGRTLRAFLAAHAPNEALARSLREEAWTFSFRPYDWSLNAARPAEPGGGGGLFVLWLVAYLVTTLGLALYGFDAYRLLVWGWRGRRRYLGTLAAARRTSALGRTVFPRVLVQVPVFNEAGVVERAIDAAAALDYPRDALEIQILDDSTDETVGIVDRVVARHRARGVPVRALRRPHREGYKAGALAAGLAVSDADYVAIFDADFVPPPEFVRRALPLFDVPGRVACVQGRWEHLNRRQNWLTRAQAIGVDAHFYVQQLGRAAAGTFLNFNGTTGMWRREAIEAAGGWRGDTITEDLDLSYRAQLRGWRIVFDPALAAPAELPPTLGAFKSQQRRWACGSMQCARKFLGPVWRSRLPLRVKGEATLHLGGYMVCVAMLALVVLLPFGIPHFERFAALPHVGPLWGIIWVAALGPVVASVVAQRRAGRVRPGEILCAFLLGLGASANNAVAALRGLWRPIRTFVRTPKQGVRIRPARSPAPVLEAVMASLTLAVIAVLAPDHPWAVATYALFCSAGFAFLTGYWWIAERAGKRV